jgi:hypothetical protein
MFTLDERPVRQSKNGVAASRGRDRLKQQRQGPVHGKKLTRRLPLLQEIAVSETLDIVHADLTSQRELGLTGRVYPGLDQPIGPENHTVYRFGIDL